MGHSTVIAFVLFIAASSAVPVRHVKRQTAQDAQVQATSTLVAGLLNFRQITVSASVINFIGEYNLNGVCIQNPGNSDSQLRDFLLETLGESGASDILCNQQLMVRYCDTQTCDNINLALCFSVFCCGLFERRAAAVLPVAAVRAHQQGTAATAARGRSVG